MRNFYHVAIAVSASLTIAACTSPENETIDASDAEGTSVMEADEPVEPIQFSMDEITCWDLTTTEEEEQAFAATLVYGYVAGAGGKSEQTSEAITAAIGAALDYCVENPDATAVEAFSKSES